MTPRSNPAMREERKIIVYPSEIHEYTYCPRYYFFHKHVGRHVTLRERMRMLLGRIFHGVKRVPDRLRGRVLEDRIEVTVGSNIVLRGRPDSYEVKGDEILVVERKSGRGPSRGVWVSDSAQASAYAFMLARLLGVKNASIRIEYLYRSRASRLDEDKVERLLRLIDEIVLVREHGVLPHAKRSHRKCSRCPFRDICYELDDGLDDVGGELYEPGMWLEKVNIDESFI